MADKLKARQTLAAIPSSLSWHHQHTSFRGHSLHLFPLLLIPARRQTNKSHLDVCNISRSTLKPSEGETQDCIHQSCMSLGLGGECIIAKSDRSAFKRLVTWSLLGSLLVRCPMPNAVTSQDRKLGPILMWAWNPWLLTWSRAEPLLKGPHSV